MGNHNNGVIIVSYTFPPKEGIGGRRWAKFSKHLAEAGFDVHVIHQQAEANEKSTWINDVKNNNIKTYEINAFYPKSFRFSGNFTVFSKITFHLWKHMLLLFYKGVIFDRSIFWKNTLKRQIKTIINQNSIDYIIITIPPFLLASHVLELKKYFPKIKFVIDYRDPWTENKSFHGFKNIKPSRLNYEKKIEKKALMNADLILNTTSQMSLWNQSKVSDISKFKVLENGFDNSEVTLKNIKTKRPYTFLLAGSIYIGLDYIIDPFVEFVLNKEKEGNEFKENFEFIFIGTSNNKLENRVKSEKIKSIKILPKIPREELNDYYNEADFFMMFSAFDHGFNFNTKFYEYLPYKKVIIHFGPDGDITEFLANNNLGRGVNPNNFYTEFNSVLNEAIRNELTFNESYSIEQFEVKSLTQKLINYLNN